VGNRTFLFVHDAQDKELDFEHCLDETNSTFALEWFAWLPKEILDTYIQTLLSNRNFLESDSDESEEHSFDWNLLNIQIPYEQAQRSLKQSLFNVLQHPPEFTPTMRDLILGIEERLSQYPNPMLTMDCFQMAGFSDIDGYIQDLQKHHGFWQLTTPLSEVDHSAAISVLTDSRSLHNLADLAHSKELASKYRELESLKARAYGHSLGKVRRANWNTKYEELITWLLGIVAAAAALLTYFLTHSSWSAGGAFFAVAIGSGLAISRTPKRKVIDTEALAAAKTLREEISMLEVTHIKLGSQENPLFSLPSDYVKKAVASKSANAFGYNQTGIWAKLWHSGEILHLPWRDLQEIEYEWDDGIPENSMLIWTVGLTEEADEQGKYEDMDGPLWFDFDDQLDPHLMLLVLRLLLYVQKPPLTQSQHS
jgi:hypothetical protein